jgi:hypothetical protein
MKTVRHVNFRSACDALFDRCASSIIWFTGTALAVAVALFALGFAVLAVVSR